jgi:DNA-binding LytR/AlgR family response regulator
MRVLLADDEPIALQRLELAAQCIPDVDVAGLARNGRQALELLRALRPDVVVLDIQMPGKDGFAVLDALGADEATPEIIFVTAFHEYAVRAFEVHAVDYLLKPVEFERFQAAMERARARLAARGAARRFAELQALLATLRDTAPPAAAAYERSLWVRVRDALLQVDVDDIDYISAEGDYVSLHQAGKASLLKDTIASLQMRLDPALFLRVHRGAIVNLSRVRALRRRGARAVELVLAAGAVVAVGPSHVDAVLKAVKAQRFRTSR